MTREHPVRDEQAHAAAIGEYKRDGYRIVAESDASTTLVHRSHGSLLAHLALFFTVGFWTLGLANVWYAIRTRRKTHDRVRVIEG